MTNEIKFVKDVPNFVRHEDWSSPELKNCVEKIEKKLNCQDLKKQI